MTVMLLTRSASASRMLCAANIACTSCDGYVVDKDTLSGFASMMHRIDVTVLNIGLRLIFAITIVSIGFG